MESIKENKYRQPTITEAVECVVRESNTKEFRRHCIEYWRERYGDKYANEIEQKAFAILRKNKQ